MNHTYRIVWSESRKAFIVAGENAKAKGKPSSTRKAVASAVVMALAALAAEPALAAVCPAAGAGGIPSTISVGAGIAVIANCTPAAGVSLTVANTGSIITGGSAVTMSFGVAAGSISNSGTIHGNTTGIHLMTGSSVSSITNNGTISGNVGIKVGAEGGANVGSINNAGGTISGVKTGINIGSISASSSVGSITNSGTISGGTYAINVNSFSTLPNINITGTSARLIGDVSATNTDVTVKSGAIFGNDNAFNVNSFTVESGATFNMGAGTNTSGMANGISVGSVANAAGYTGFTNAGTLAVAAGVTGAINGNYTQLAGSTFQTYATSNSSYGKLLVNGTAVLPSAANIYVYVNPGNTLAAGQTLYSVISSTGTLTSSTFHVTDNNPLFIFTAVIDPNNPNAIDLIVKSATQAPLLNGDMGLFTFDMLQGINRIVQARQEENLGLSTGEDFVTNRNAWVKPLGSWANQSDNNGVSGYKASTYGVVLGADGELSPISRLGTAFAISHSNVNNNLGSQSAGVDSYQLVLYGSRSLDDKNTEFNWQADYGTNQNTGNRNIQFLNQNAAASYTSDSIHLGAGVGRKLDMNEKTSFTPSFRADYTTLHVNGYTEAGAGASNLVVNGSTTDEFILLVDGKVTHKLSDTTTLLANLGVGYDMQAKQSSITAAFQGGGAAFTTPGINPSPTVVRGGLGMVVNSSKMVEITGRYDIEARTGFTAQTLSVKARWPF